ncbi:MAG: hypothetical protein IKW83_06050 [Muribaculaceae bacterium]|nr:hypothetical protein [Muribaculaceae bacterium]
MDTYNQTSNYENDNEREEFYSQDIEITDLNGDGQTEITGYMNIGDVDVKIVDIDRDGTFDIAFADYDGDGIFNMKVVADISDMGINDVPFMAAQLIDDPLELLEYGFERAFVGFIDDSQTEINEDVSISDFMPDSKVVELDVMLEQDEMIYDCESCCDDMMF